MVILDLGEGERGVLGVEPLRGARPGRASEGQASQIWLDPLLALSMLQHPSRQWRWARFVIVYAGGNPSWAPLVARYRGMLRDGATFGASTFDELVESEAFEAEVRTALVERYRCW